MIIIEKLPDGIEKEYKVMYNRENLIKLRKQIREDCNIRRRGEKILKDIDYYPDIYRDRDIYHYPTFDTIESTEKLPRKENTYGYENYKVKGIINCAPELVNIIHIILNGYETGINDLYQYKDSLELIPYPKRKQQLYNQIEKLPITMPKEKERLLNLYSQTIEESELNKEFDFDKLNSYYEAAKNNIYFELIKETHDYSKQKQKIRKPFKDL